MGLYVPVYRWRLLVERQDGTFGVYECDSLNELQQIRGRPGERLTQVRDGEATDERGDVSDRPGPDQGQLRRLD